MEAAGGDGSYRRQCAALSVRIHHLAATTLSKVGEADLAWIAAEPAMQAANTAKDPLVLVSAARSGTHALLAVGRFGNAAARRQTPRVEDGDPATLSLYGICPTCAQPSLLRALAGPGIVFELLAKAEVASDALGEDANTG